VTQTETWATAIDRLALILGGPSERYHAEVEVWLRQSVAAAFSVESLHALDQTRRALAFQRFLLVVYDLAGLGELAFSPALRQIVAAAFADRFGIDAPAGPDWRISPSEPDRLSYAQATDDEIPF
jgi:hypothetical protein